MSVATLFIHATARHFREDYLPRLERALTALPDEDLWWRPHPEATSVGVLVRHLEGNVRQWILSGLGGAPDQRERTQEVVGQPTGTKEALATALRRTVEEALAVIEELDEAGLARRYDIQGFHTTALEAIYHVLEHFSWHIGQITWIVKMRAGPAHGVAFYDDEALDEARNAGS